MSKSTKVILIGTGVLFLLIAIGIYANYRSMFGAEGLSTRGNTNNYNSLGVSNTPVKAPIEWYDKDGSGKRYRVAYEGNDIKVTWILPDGKEWTFVNDKREGDVVIIAGSSPMFKYNSTPEERKREEEKPQTVFTFDDSRPLKEQIKEGLRKYMDNGDSYRGSFVAEIVKLKEESIPIITTMLKEAEGRRKLGITFILGHLFSELSIARNSEELRSVFLKTIQDEKEDKDVRRVFVVLSEHMADKRFVAPLLKLLDSDKWLDKDEIVDTLGLIGDASALPALKRLEDTNTDAKAAIEKIEIMTSPNKKDDLLAILYWSKRLESWGVRISPAAEQRDYSNREWALYKYMDAETDDVTKLSNLKRALELEKGNPEPNLVSEILQAIKDVEGK